MKEEKALVIETLREWVKSSPYLIVLDYTGMKVVKNTLFKRAIGESALSGLDKDFVGQTAVVAGGKDAPAAAKVIKTFKAEFTRPVLRSGVMDGQLLGTKELLVLADLPSMDVLRGKILGVISAPASTLVRLLAEPGARLARVVRSKADAAPAAGV